MIKKLAVFFALFFWVGAFAQLKVCSWNLCDMGQSKSAQTLTLMAQTLRDFDVVALQEITIGPQGAQAVAAIVQLLNRSGAQWDYALSDATQGSRQKRERYAFLWKPSRVKLVGKPWLDAHFETQIEREPFMGTFRYQKQDFTLVNFHAITKKMQPETEVKYFRNYPALYPKTPLVFVGDFNCPQTHSVFNPLKNMGFSPVFIGTKTTLKMACKGGCTASEFDNMFYPSAQIKVLKKGVVPFYEGFDDLKAARKVSDHIPVWAALEFH